MAVSVAAFPVRAADLAYAGSVLLSSGTYGLTERTTGFSFLNELNLSVHPVRVSLGFPLLAQSTSWVSTTGAGVIPRGEVDASSASVYLRSDQTSESEGVYGIGDPIARVDIEAIGPHEHLPVVTLIGEAKIPFADTSSGLGTGEWDYGAGISLAKAAGSTLLLVEAVYWALGDLPDTDFENPLSLSASLGRSFDGGKALASVIYLSCTEIVSGVEPPRQIGVGFNYLLSGGRGAGGTAMIGLSDSSPDVSLSVGMTIPLN